MMGILLTHYARSHTKFLTVPLIEYGTLGANHIQRLTDDDFNITNLERITSDVGARGFLGIVGGDCTKSSHGKQWLLAIWQRVVETILDSSHRGEKFTVDKNINNSALILQFISEVVEDMHGKHPDAANPAGTPGSSGSSGTSSAGKVPEETKGAKKASKAKAKIKQPTTKERRGLIAKSFAPGHLEPQKIVDLVDELKRLEVINFANCTGVMFRVFLELSVLHYMKKHKIKSSKPHKKNPTQQVDLTLREKISVVASHLQDAGKFDKNGIKPLKDISAPSHPISAESLNAYVHSADVAADSNALKVQWNNLQSIFETLWGK
jgi:hypothetical protein